MDEELLAQEIQKLIILPKSFFEVQGWYGSEHKNEYKFEATLQHSNKLESISRVRFGIRFNERYGKEYSSFRLDYINENKFYCITRIDFNDLHTNKKPLNRNEIKFSHIHPFLENYNQFGIIEALTNNLPYAVIIEDKVHNWDEMIVIASNLFNINDIISIPRPPIQEELQL